MTTGFEQNSGLLITYRKGYVSCADDFRAYGSNTEGIKLYTRTGYCRARKARGRAAFVQTLLLLNFEYTRPRVRDNRIIERVAFTIRDDVFAVPRVTREKQQRNAVYGSRGSCTSRGHKTRSYCNLRGVLTSLPPTRVP